MILRAMGLGFLLWLAMAAAFRFGGHYFFTPDESMRMVEFIAAPIVGGVITFVFLKLLKEAHGDEAEAAVGVAFPNVLLNAFLVYNFSTAFPNVDSTLDTAYATLVFLFCAGILFTGLSLTALAPQDERV